MSLGPYDSYISTVYSASVDGTKAEVTDNPVSHVYTITLHNAAAAEAFLQIFDADADSVTVGTTSPTIVFACEAASVSHFEFKLPIRLTTGFTVACTTARAGATGSAMEVTITYNSATS